MIGWLNVFGFGAIISFWFLMSLLPFVWAMNHLVKIKRPLSMKAIWAAICFLGGILGVILYAIVVYLPEQNKKKA